MLQKYHYRASQTDKYNNTANIIIIIIIIIMWCVWSSKMSQKSNTNEIERYNWLYLKNTRILASSDSFCLITSHIHSKNRCADRLYISCLVWQTLYSFLRWNIFIQWHVTVLYTLHVHKYYSYISHRQDRYNVIKLWFK